jgi:hypothetical protein
MGSIVRFEWTDGRNIVQFMPNLLLTASSMSSARQQKA